MNPNEGCDQTPLSTKTHPTEFPHSISRAVISRQEATHEVINDAGVVVGTLTEEMRNRLLEKGIKENIVIVERNSNKPNT